MDLPAFPVRLTKLAGTGNYNYPHLFSLLEKYFSLCPFFYGDEGQLLL
ncbi:MAG: hypothetical protein SCH71_03620 [Desulfobulbaceae bacterium]|nr:hypothetical protein [Desulfobulbaceae bacterium]